MSSKHREDLDWLAFRYVAAELSAAESREFEDRLERDQEAREAVGRVVEVTCVVRSLDWDDTGPRVTPVRRRHVWHQRRSVQWFAALAVGLALAVLVWGPPRGEPDGWRDGSPAGGLVPSELALVWSSARTEWDAESDADGWEKIEPGIAEPGIASDRRFEAPWDDEAAIDTPDWMFVAVVAMESETEDRNEPATNNLEGT